MMQKSQHVLARAPVTRWTDWGEQSSLPSGHIKSILFMYYIKTEASFLHI